MAFSDRIRALGVDDVEGLLALNNTHAVETSALTATDARHLIDISVCARCVEEPERAFIVVLDQQAPYPSPNFRWLRERFDRFWYVDRVIVSADWRRRGYAAALYEHTFQTARARGEIRVVCEVNEDPPNPGSEAFHRRLGFEEVGRARLEERGKTVRYLQHRLV